MKIIITEKFSKDFVKIFKTDSLVNNFCNFLEDKLYNIIDLKFPYSKIKLKFLWINIRLIIYIWNQDFLIPIFIIKKVDKKYWMNLVLNKDIINILEKNLEITFDNIKNNKYKIH